MNTTRVVWAGLAAGLVMNVLDFITNVTLFGEAWNAAYAALHITPSPAIPVFWISFDFINGLMIAFLYAAMRPRFGAGPKTAVVAGLLAWAFVHLTLFSHAVDHVFPPRVLAGTASLEFVSALVGAQLAGWLYREGPGGARQPLV